MDETTKVLFNTGVPNFILFVSLRVVDEAQFQLGSWHNKEFLLEFANKYRVAVINDWFWHAMEFDDVIYKLFSYNLCRK